MSDFELGAPVPEWFAVKLRSIVSYQGVRYPNLHTIAFQRKFLITPIVIVIKGPGSTHLVKYLLRPLEICNSFFL
jgi:hypothetical protein